MTPTRQDGLGVRQIAECLSVLEAAGIPQWPRAVQNHVKASSHAWKSHLTVQYGRTGRDPLPSKGCNGAVISPDVRFSGAFLLLLHWRLNGRDPHRQKTLPKCTVSTGYLRISWGPPFTLKGSLLTGGTPSLPFTTHAQLNVPQSTSTCLRLQLI